MKHTPTQKLSGNDIFKMLSDDDERSGFIVKAVNCHDELVEACKDALSALRYEKKMGGRDYSGTIIGVEQALAKAEAL